MKQAIYRLAVAAVMALAIALPAGASAGERVAVFSVAGLEWACASCRYIVEQSMMAVPGVASATVSLENRTATVVFDDAETTVEDIANASANMGFPARALPDAS